LESKKTFVSRTITDKNAYTNRADHPLSIKTFRPIRQDDDCLAMQAFRRLGSLTRCLNAWAISKQHPSELHPSELALNRFLDIVGHQRADFLASDSLHNVAILAEIEHHQRHAVLHAV